MPSSPPCPGDLQQCRSVSVRRYLGRGQEEIRGRAERIGDGG